MAKRKSQAKKKPAAPVDETNDTEGVGRLIAEMAHPLTSLIEDVREAVLKADAAITEGSEVGIHQASTAAVGLPPSTHAAPTALSLFYITVPCPVRTPYSAKRSAIR